MARRVGQRRLGRQRGGAFLYRSWFLHFRRPRKTVVQSGAATENETGSDTDELGSDEQDLSQIGTKGPPKAAA
jgi:hypothetical protein